MLESLRLQALAANFGPVFTRSFEDCVGHGGTSASECIAEIYRALQLPPRTLAVAAPRVSSSMRLVRNRGAVEAMVRDCRAGNWSLRPQQPVRHLAKNRMAAVAQQQQQPQLRQQQPPPPPPQRSWWDLRPTHDSMQTKGGGGGGGGGEAHRHGGGGSSRGANANGATATAAYSTPLPADVLAAAEHSTSSWFRNWRDSLVHGFHSADVVEGMSNGDASA